MLQSKSAPATPQTAQVAQSLSVLVRVQTLAVLSSRAGTPRGSEEEYVSSRVTRGLNRVEIASWRLVRAP